MVFNIAEQTWLSGCQAGITTTTSSNNSNHMKQQLSPLLFVVYPNRQQGFLNYNVI